MVIVEENIMNEPRPLLSYQQLVELKAQVFDNEERTAVLYTREDAEFTRGTLTDCVVRPGELILALHLADESESYLLCMAEPGIVWTCGHYYRLEFIDESKEF
jgi:hypothetical protein